MEILLITSNNDSEANDCHSVCHPSGIWISVETLYFFRAEHFTSDKRFYSQAYSANMQSFYDLLTASCVIFNSGFAKE